MQFQLLGWGPDLDPSTPGVLVDVNNVIPSTDGYRAMEPFELVDGGSIGGKWRSFILSQVGTNLRINAVLTDATFVSATFAATIYNWELGGSFSSAYSYSSTSTTWAVPVIMRQFDNNIIAARAKQKLVAIDSAGTGGVITSSPTCTTVETTRDFVIAFNTDAGFDWHCSAIGDERDWALSVSNQCVRGKLFDIKGPITAASKLNENVLAFSRSQCWLGRYVGAPDVWQWDRVSGDVGCVGPEAVAETPYGVVWVSPNDIHIYDGSVIRSLNTDPVRQTIFAGISRPLIRYAQVYWERKRGLLWFAFSPVSDTSFRYRTTAFAYHFESKRWSKADLSALAGGAVFTAFAQGGVQDYAIGTATWAQGVQQFDDLLIAVDISAANFMRASTTAQTAALGYVESGYIGNPSRSTMIRSVRPLFSSNDNSNGTLTLETRVQGLSGGSTATQTTTLDADFKYPLRQTGRWHSFKHVLTGTDVVNGYEVDLVPVGTR